MFFFKQTTAYEMATGLEFRRVPFRSLGTMAGLEPGRALPLVAALAVWIAFASATQDVAIDAFRIELAPVAMQGALSAGYILGYRCALLVAGAGALYLDQFDVCRPAY